jgi:hypothetical protein
MILDVMRENQKRGLSGTIEEATEVDDRVIVGFRPGRSHPLNPDRPLDRGLAYLVLTMRHGKVVEMKGCADRAAAAYARPRDPRSGFSG